MFELTIEKREETGTKKLQSLRTEGFMPGVVYGKKEESTPIKLNMRDFKKAFKTAGESSIISLKGLKEDLDVLIHEVSFEPVNGEPVHVDFYAIERGKTLTVSVPLEFVGESPAVKGGAILVKVMHEIEIEVLPRDLPQHIDVDISSIIDLDSAIHIKDLKLPDGVVPTSEPDEVVALANAAVEEVFEEPVAVDMDAIEVEEKGKGEDNSDGDGDKKDEKKEEGDK